MRDICAPLASGFDDLLQKKVARAAPSGAQPMLKPCHLRLLSNPPAKEQARAKTATCATASLRTHQIGALVAHDCGYPLSRYTCRATRVAADFLDFIAFCRCSTGVALHPLKILVSHLPPPPVPGGVAPKFGPEKVSRYTGVSQLQLRVSRYTVQLRSGPILKPEKSDLTWAAANGGVTQGA